MLHQEGGEPNVPRTCPAYHICRLLFKHLWCEARLLFKHLECNTRVVCCCVLDVKQDFYSKNLDAIMGAKEDLYLNILGAKQDFCSKKLGAKQDFC